MAERAFYEQPDDDSGQGIQPAQPVKRESENTLYTSIPAIVAPNIRRDRDMDSPWNQMIRDEDTQSRNQDMYQGSAHLVDSSSADETVSVQPAVQQNQYTESRDHLHYLARKAAESSWNRIPTGYEREEIIARQRAEAAERAAAEAREAFRRDDSDISHEDAARIARDLNESSNVNSY